MLTYQNGNSLIIFSLIWLSIAPVGFILKSLSGICPQHPEKVKAKVTHCEVKFFYCLSIESIGQHPALFESLPRWKLETHLAKQLFEMNDPVLVAVELGQDCDEFSLPEGARDHIGVWGVGQ